MCWSSKKKTEKINSSAGQVNQRKNEPEIQYSSTNEISLVPRSQVSFNANSFEFTKFLNADKYIPTTKADRFVEPNLDRLEDYAMENNQARDSRLIAPK